MSPGTKSTIRIAAMLCCCLLVFASPVTGIVKSAAENAIYIDLDLGTSGEFPDLDLGHSGSEAEEEEDENIPSLGFSLVDNYADGWYEVYITEDPNLPSPFEQFKQALVNPPNGAAKIRIYLTDDLALTGAVRVSEKVEEFVIDGGGNHLTEYYSSARDYAIYVGYTNTKAATLQNITITGYNYYGTVSSIDGVDFTLRYKDVIYRGNQMTHNIGGTVYYENVDATIIQLGPSEANEIAEAKSITLSGEINFRNLDLTTEAHEIFYFVTTGSSLTVEPEARVNIWAKNHFIHSGVIYAFTIGEGAEFNLYTNRGFEETSQGMNVFTLGENAWFHVESYNTAAEYGMIMRGNFTVNQGATFIYTTNASQAKGVITFDSAAYRATFDNPNYVLISSKDRPPLFFHGTNNSLYITTQQLNYWAAGNGGDVLGGDRWQKRWTVDPGDSGAVMKVDIDRIYETGVYNNSDANFRHSGVAQGEGLDAMTPASVNWSAAGILSMGRQLVEADGYEYPADEFAGTATPDSRVRIAYTNNTGGTSTDYLLEGSTGWGTHYAIPLSETEKIVPGTAVKMESQRRRGYLYWSGLYQSGTGSLEFGGLVDLRFPVSRLSSLPETIGRIDNNWTVTVLDSRGPDSEPWRLSARLSSPLSSTGLPALENALVYIGEDGNPLPLEILQQGVPIGDRTQSWEYRTDVVWDGDKGFLVQVQTGEAYATTYTGTIEWTLTDAPSA